MASQDEYQQQQFFKEKKLVPINGGVDGRKTWKIAGNLKTDLLWCEYNAKRNNDLIEFKRNKT